MRTYSLICPFWQIIEECDTRMEEKIDDFVEMILQVLPAHPSQAEPNEESGEGKEETVQ